MGAIAKELVSAAKELMGGGWGRFSEDLSDVLEAQVSMNKGKSAREIARIVKSDAGIARMMKEERMSDKDLAEMIDESRRMFGSDGRRTAAHGSHFDVADGVWSDMYAAMKTMRFLELHANRLSDFTEELDDAEDRGGKPSEEQVQKAREQVRFMERALPIMRGQIDSLEKSLKRAGADLDRTAVA